jgi:hypothetical protein
MGGRKGVVVLAPMAAKLGRPPRHALRRPRPCMHARSWPAIGSFPHRPCAPSAGREARCVHSFDGWYSSSPGHRSIECCVYVCWECFVGFQTQLAHACYYPDQHELSRECISTRGKHFEYGAMWNPHFGHACMAPCDKRNTSGFTQWWSPGHSCD